MGIIVDLFAGAGGASEGIKKATGKDPDAAVNHDPVAVAVHSLNHPTTRHYCQDVWTVHPAWVSRGRVVDLLWASPDCTHHSKAKGAAPIRNEQRRDLAMVIADKWAPALMPRLIVLENVEEFQDWGPLDKDGKIVAAAKGQKFREFVNRLRRRGYVVEWRELRACDYGAPTTRNRLYLMARCDGLPIVWPEPTHGAPNSPGVLSGKLKPWRTAAECIDFSLPCPSIFATSQEIWEQYGLRAVRPLAESTMRRIFRGLHKFVLNNPEPFIIKNYTGVVGHQTDRPLGAVTTIDHHALVEPYLTTYYGDKGDGVFRGRGMGDQVPTLTTENRCAMVTPYLQHVQHGGKPNDNRTGCMSADDPMRTITALPKGGGMAMVAPILTSPAHSKTTGRGEYVYSPDDPLRTICATPSHAVAAALLVGAGGPEFAGKPTAADKPMGAVMTENHRAVVAANMLTLNGKSDAAGAGEPARTATARGKLGVVTSHLAKMRGTNTGQPHDDPLQTVTASGQHFAEVRAFLMKYYGSEVGQDQACDRPLDTVTAKARFGVVTVHGQDYIIADIGMRMLQPRELARAMGFPDSYVIERGADDRPTTKAEQVRLIGNAVCPDVAEALIRANYVETREETAQIVAAD